MRIKARSFFRFLAKGYLVIAGVVILVGQFLVLWNDGWSAFFEMVNPRNPWNAIATILVLAPGVVLFALTEEAK